MFESAHWSDMFFNYVPAEQAYSEWVSNPDIEEDEKEALLLEQAKQFLQTNPDCPYDANWLVKDFIKRL
jgi:hypothetical protein